MMINKFLGCTNENIVVTSQLGKDCVIIQETKGDKREKWFAGFPLEIMFNDFSDIFSEDVTFDDAVKYFTPNIGNYVVNPQL